MSVLTSWWNPETGLTGVTVPLDSAVAPRRGTFGGQCFHPTCRTKGADWYNNMDRRYYCDHHARGINEHCLAYGLPKECELHL